MRRRCRLLLVAVVTAVMLALGAAAALAAGPVDDSSYSEADKLTAEREAAELTAQRTCGLLAVGPLAELRPDCEAALVSQFTRETVPTLAGSALCAAATGVSIALRAVCLALVATQADQVQEWFWSAYGAALGAVEAVAAGVAFIADPTLALDHFANDLKQDAVSLFTSAMTTATQLTSFDAQADWWRTAYAATAGIGVAVLGLMLLLTLWQASTGRIGPQEGARSVLLFPTVGLLMLFMGPPVAWAVSWVADGLSAGVITWMGQDTVEFLSKAGTFTALTAGRLPGGLGMGLLLFGLLFLAGVGVLGTFIVQTISVYVLGAVLGVSWGMAGNPRWRPKALRLPMVWVGLVLAKPAMLLVLGLVMKLSNAVDLTPAGAQEGVAALVQALMVVIALVLVAFAPWTLLKWFPLLPDGSESVRSSGPVAMGAAVGAAGSTLTTMAMLRANRGSGAGSPVRGPRSVSPVSPPNAGPAGGRAGAAGATAVHGGRAGAAGAAKAARSTAAGAGRAAGGISTGGALLAAQLAASGAQAAITKAQQSAEAAGPDIRGGEQ